VRTLLILLTTVVRALSRQICRPSSNLESRSCDLLVFISSHLTPTPTRIDDDDDEIAYFSMH